jgi:hypothetical protein
MTLSPARKLLFHFVLLMPSLALCALVALAGLAAWVSSILHGPTLCARRRPCRNSTFLTPQHVPTWLKWTFYSRPISAT